MNILERLLLAIIILEIPLRVGVHLFYQESEAEFGAIGGIGVSLTTFCLIGLYGSWLLETVNPERTSRKLLLSVPLLLYVSIAMFSLVVAENRLLTVSFITLLGQALLLFVYVANRLRTRDDLVFLAGMLAVALAMQSTIIIGSWLLGPRMEGRVLALGPLSVSVWLDGRCCGTFGSPVSAASYLALLMLPVGSLLLMPVSRRVKLLALYAVASAALAIPLTQTRASVIAVGIAAAVFGVLLHLRGQVPRWALATALLLLAVAAYPAIQVFQQRAVSTDEGSAISRIHLAQIAWQLIQDHPVVGVGANNYRAAAEPYASAAPFRSEWAYVVHCTYLLVWAETGIFGLVAFLAFLMSTMVYGWSIWQRRDPLLSPLALAIAVTVLGQMTHMLFDLFNSRAYTETLWLFAAMLFAMPRLGGAPFAEPARREPRLGRHPHVALGGRLRHRSGA